MIASSNSMSSAFTLPWASRTTATPSTSSRSIIVSAVRLRSPARRRAPAPAFGIALVGRVERDAGDHIAVALGAAPAPTASGVPTTANVLRISSSISSPICTQSPAWTAVQLGLQIAPAVQFEHRPVRRGGAVERDLLAGAGGRLLDLLVVRAGDDEARPGDLEARPGLSASCRPWPGRARAPGSSPRGGSARS